MYVLIVTNFLNEALQWFNLGLIDGGVYMHLNGDVSSKTSSFLPMWFCIFEYIGTDVVFKQKPTRVFNVLKKFCDGGMKFL